MEEGCEEDTKDLEKDIGYLREYVKLSVQKEDFFAFVTRMENYFWKTHIDE